MRRIRLESPAVSKHTVSFRWTVEPSTPLYRKQEFSLRFPESVDASTVPECVWWRIAMICLHSHWTLLKPCRIELPVRLDPGETEFWMRLVDSEAATLEAHRGSADFRRAVEIDEHGASLDPLPRIPESDRSVSAFSGGKDSLLQAALLCEILPRPTLVATTAPMPPTNDHETGRRRRVFFEISARRNVSLVEVHSDFRSTWDNGFARAQGYPVWIAEISDVFLYFSSLLAVAFAQGAPHLFVASESEVQQSADRGGRIIQHTHFMYSVATQRALETLLKPAGISYTSTTAALCSAQVERLLRQRYRDLCDLQYSCPDVDDEGAPCSRCPKCFRAALCALAEGDSPEPMGIDVGRLLSAMQLWTPRSDANGRALPVRAVSAQLDRQVLRYIENVSFRRIASAAGRRKWRTMLAYARIRRRTLGKTAGAEPGYSKGFLATADSLVRFRLEAIFSRYFPAPEDPASSGVLRRSDALSRWITEPIGGLP